MIWKKKFRQLLRLFEAFIETKEKQFFVKREKGKVKVVVYFDQPTGQKAIFYKETFFTLKSYINI